MTDTESATARSRSAAREGKALRRRNEVKPLTLYEAAAQAGEEELGRPNSALLLSAIPAGLAIAASPFAVAALAAAQGDAPNIVISGLGYPAGFILIVLARLQLFTETTLTAVLPLTLRRSRRDLVSLLRFWVLVLAGNVLAAVLIGAAAPHLLPERLIEPLVAVSHHAFDDTPFALLIRALPAGFLIALLAWSLPGLSNGRVLAVFVITYIIALGEYPHVIAGSVELGVLLFLREISLLDALVTDFLPVLAGNVIGGTALFAGLAYAQVRVEIQEAREAPPSD